MKNVVYYSEKDSRLIIAGDEKFLLDKGISLKGLYLCHSDDKNKCFYYFKNGKKVILNIGDKNE